MLCTTYQHPPPQVKIVGLLVLSGYILQEGKTFTPRLAVGCLGALLGFCMYSHTRLMVAQRTKQSVKAVKDVEDVTEAKPLLVSEGKGEE